MFLLRTSSLPFVINVRGYLAGAKRIYIQASYIIANDETREREFGNLRNIKDNYPKYVISMTPGVIRNDDNGITHLHLRNFLMADNLY